MVAVFYLVLLLCLVVFSYSFVDYRFYFKPAKILGPLIIKQPPHLSFLYSLFVILLFIFYFRFLLLVKRKKLTPKKIWELIGLTALILFFAYPGFSYDVFNYMATARVTFLHRENPYLIMPIEIPNEPMLKFMHAANKTSLYGPIWILLTTLPHFLGLGNLFLTVFTFKLLVILFYFGLILLIWRLSNKNLWSLTFFALNPLVVMETLASGHNDVVMMFFALASFYLLQKKKFWPALAGLFLSIMIKFATIFLLPVFIYAVWQTRYQKINWPKIWLYAFYSTLLIFLLSPLREEIYSWYFIWPLTFVSLLSNSQLLKAISLGFSFGLPFRLAPYLYTLSWAGITPKIKKIVTFLPPILVIFYFQTKKWLLKK